MSELQVLISIKNALWVIAWLIFLNGASNLFRD